MILKAIVYYKRALAHYLVESDDAINFYARLMRYDGKANSQPPRALAFTKKHFSNSLPLARLRNELLALVKQKINRQGNEQLI